MNIDAQSIRDQFDAEAARRTSASIDYLKLTGGQNEVRLLPSNPLFVCVPLHKYTVDGKFSPCMDYREILNNLEIQEFALGKGYISQADIDLAREYSDPFIRLAQTAGELGVDSQVVTDKKLWPSTRYFWNALDMTQDNPSVQLFETSKVFFEQVKDTVLPKYPEIFQLEDGRNLGIAGNGQDGFRRRYSAPMPEPEKSTVVVDPDDFIDLVAAAARKVRKYEEKVDHLFSRHAEFISDLGVTKADFGV